MQTWSFQLFFALALRWIFELCFRLLGKTMSNFSGTFYFSFDLWFRSHSSFYRIFRPFTKSAFVIHSSKKELCQVHSHTNKEEAGKISSFVTWPRYTLKHGEPFLMKSTLKTVESRDNENIEDFFFFVYVWFLFRKLQQP